ncbi:IS3 family transposase [Limosilactobacillus portuensis]|uniref:IS3 family transposase n=1 Tax=Limosilactobacillus portuensis TaxID=2742601 RepID=UPI003D7540C5
MKSPITKSRNGDCLRKKINGNTQSGGGQGHQFQAIKELNSDNGWSISQLCKVAGVSRDGYYKWLKRKPSRYQKEQAELLETILDLEEEHKWTLGHLAMTTQLKFENRLSFTAGLKRVTNCMRKHGIKANIRKKKHNRIQRHEEYVNDNLLNEQFDRENKNEVWVTDTTEVTYGDYTLHKVRVHVILDLYGRYVLSYNISDTETSSAVIETFNRAFEVEADARPMIHTDRGAAYCSSMFNNYLASKNCVHSMSHPGHPWENSPMERWWNDFKLVWMNKHARPKTLEELEQLVKGAIEYFNKKRAYTSRNGLTAEQFRNQAA